MSAEKPTPRNLVRRPIVIALGKLMVYVAWADGVIQDEEIEVIKDLVFTIPDLTQEEWASVQIYFEYPISERERDQLLHDFIVLLSHDSEKTFAVEAIRRVLEADGVAEPEQQAVFEEFREAILSKGTGLLARLIEILSRLLRLARVRREAALASTYSRERELDDFINNPVFFRLTRSLLARRIHTNFTKMELRKLSLAGSIMAKIAQADQEIHDDEVAVIYEVLLETWHLSEDAALLVTEIALNKEYGSLDMLRICRQFYEVTTEDERLQFMRTLAEIVQADDVMLKPELDEIEAVAANLKVPRNELKKMLGLPDLPPAV